jgi:HD superfamily phosphohydrolase
MNMSSKEDLLIRCPIHGFIDLSEYDFVPQVIKLPEFQRLRRLAQLGFSVMVYPSAEHNRFSHCLGAMQIFWRLFDKMKPNLNGGIPVEDLRKYGTAVALLHDIGHGPFSHAAEQAFDFDHEEIGKELILTSGISNVLNDHQIDPVELTRILEGTADKKYAPLSQLVSSQLDVDRLDYLLRDAYFTGIGFGNVDLDRIISTMVVCQDEVLRGQAVNLYKGRFSVESYVLTRHLMYQAVYFHKATRAAELLFRNAIKRARALGDKLEMPTELSFIKERRKPNAQDLLQIDDNLMYTQFCRWRKSDDQVLSELCDRIVNRNLLKAVEIPPEKSTFIWEERKKLEEIAERNNIDAEYFCPSDSPTDLPYQPYSPKEPDDKPNVITNIFVLNEHAKPVEISHLSNVVASLSHPQYANRLYCPESIREEVSNLLKEHG